MGSRVNVCSVNVLDNPAKLNDPFKLEITFEAFEPLPDDLDWELVYVGSAESEKYDQVLDSALVGPVVEGRHKFIFEADGPDPSKIPEDDIVGVTVLLLRCSYREQVFIKIGWFVTLEYTDPEMKENPPAVPILDQLQRTVCLDDIHVTTYPIKWDNSSSDIDKDLENGDATDANLNGNDSNEYLLSNDNYKQQSSNNNSDLLTTNDSQLMDSTPSESMTIVDKNNCVDNVSTLQAVNVSVPIGSSPLNDLTNNDQIPDLVD
ncbi:unnamed protein product [Anisakis simplex]|uniref:Histone chaperone asf1 n=1 Tax=Anisakis simplex TaxID=6269 RepID=A0A0M3K4Z3_ANISI|nr:unnamed protein product [Anisakis simplex]